MCTFLLIIAMAAETQAFGADCGLVERVETFHIAQQAPAEASCSTYLDQNSHIAVSCYWEFSYRNDQALRMAGELWQLLETCVPGRPKQGDGGVNHPDSYVSRYWAGNLGMYRVSIKDKAVSRRTLVFLAIERSK